LPFPFHLHYYNVFGKSPLQRTKDLKRFSTIDTPDLAEQEKENALIERINAEVLAESGVELDQLINPSKVVNLERDIINLTEQLSISGDVEKEQIQNKIDKKRSTLAIEKRAVMRNWLKNLFVGQSVLAGVISFLMVYNIVPGYEGNLPLAGQVLGFWMWWLFIIPSLRARKPSTAEKDALNIAFVGSPLLSLALPAATKDVALIWWANAAVVAASYVYAYFIKQPEEVSQEVEQEAGGGVLLKVLKALDYGSGQERGARK